MFDFDFFDFFLVFEEGPKEVDDFNSLVPVRFLFISEDFVDKIEERLKELDEGFDLIGETVISHVKVEFDGDGDVDEGLDDFG